MRRISALGTMMAAMLMGSKPEPKTEPQRVSGNEYIIHPTPIFRDDFISTAKTDHGSIAMNGKFNHRNNLLFSSRIKASMSYIPQNSKAQIGRAV